MSYKSGGTEMFHQQQVHEELEDATSDVIKQYSVVICDPRYLLAYSETAHDNFKFACIVN